MKKFLVQMKGGRKRKVKGFRRLSWQRLLIGIVLLVFIILILFRFAELQQIAALVQKINWGWLIIALIAQFAVFGSLAGIYTTLLQRKKNRRKSNGNKGISFFYLFKTAIAMLFVDHTLPSFSASGNILLYHASRKKGIKEGSASLLIGLNIFLNFLFYFVVFIAGLAYLLISQKIVGLEWIWLPLVLIIASFILVTRVLFTESGQRHFKTVMNWLLRRWPRAQHRTFKTLSNLYRAKKELRKSSLALAFVFAAAVYVCKIIAIGFVFLALGNLVNPGIIITGYFITAFLSTISYIRVGIYEAAMTGAYAGLGIEYNLALTATLLYRAIAWWLPMILGFFFFRNIIRSKDERKR